MKIAVILVTAVLVIVALGLVVLGSMDIPAPSTPIEKPIPADRLPH